MIHLPNSGSRLALMAACVATIAGVFPGMALAASKNSSAPAPVPVQASSPTVKLTDAQLAMYNEQAQHPEAFSGTVADMSGSSLKFTNIQTGTLDIPGVVKPDYIIVNADANTKLIKRSFVPSFVMPPVAAPDKSDKNAKDKQAPAPQPIQLPYTDDKLSPDEITIGARLNIQGKWSGDNFTAQSIMVTAFPSPTGGSAPPPAPVMPPMPPLPQLPPPPPNPPSIMRQ